MRIDYRDILMVIGIVLALAGAWAMAGWGAVLFFGGVVLCFVALVGVLFGNQRQ